MKKVTLVLSVLGIALGAFVASIDTSRGGLAVGAPAEAGCSTWERCQFCTAGCDCNGPESTQKSCTMETNPCGPFDLLTCNSCKEVSGCDEGSGT